jgi:transcriptional regulator with XRE-family HTH domain
MSRRQGADEPPPSGSGHPAVDMPARERLIDVARMRARTIRVSIGGEIRSARTARDLSQRTLARATGIAQSRVSLIERGLLPSVDADELVILSVAVGLDLSVRAYPGGSPIRDAAHATLLSEFRAQLPPSVGWRAEVPLPLRGDRRAWDAVADLGRLEVGIEAETRIRDVQELQRRIALKKRDAAIERVVLVVRGSRANRATLRAFGSQLGTTFPVSSEVALAALQVGRDPGGDAIVALDPPGRSRSA